MKRKRFSYSIARFVAAPGTSPPPVGRQRPALLRMPSCYHGRRHARMLNGIFVVVALASILAAALSGEMRALTDAVVSSARGAVDLAIGLVGVMAFFLGLMRVASDAGLMARLARLVSPVMRLLFPGLPRTARP